MIKGDVIKITDKDILDSFSYSLYGLPQSAAQKENEEWKTSIWNQFEELLFGGKKEYKILAFDSQHHQRNYHLQLVTILINNWKDKYYLQDTFLVDECHEDHFTIKPLNEYQRTAYNGNQEFVNIMTSMKFPYKEEESKFWKMGCNWS